MLARSPAFICATAVTCVLLVGGDRSAEDTELLANADVPGLTTAQIKDRRLAECYTMKKKADCEAMKKGCGGCKWEHISLVPDGQCRAPGCYDYKDRTSCCANALKVDEGCYWQKIKSRNMSSRNMSRCVAMTCDAVARVCGDSGHNCTEAKMACKAQKGCTYLEYKNNDGLGTCMDSNIECNWIENWCGKKNPCTPTLLCSRCFSSCTTADCTAQYKKELEGKCADECKGIVHCVEEVKCLKEKTDGNDKCDQKGSCVSEIVFPNPTCEAACQEFDKECQKCGAKTTCDGGSSGGGSSGTAARVAPSTSVAKSSHGSGLPHSEALSVLVAAIFWSL